MNTLISPQLESPAIFALDTDGVRYLCRGECHVSVKIGTGSSDSLKGGVRGSVINECHVSKR